MKTTLKSAIWWSCVNVHSIYCSFRLEINIRGMGCMKLLDSVEWSLSLKRTHSLFPPDFLWDEITCMNKGSQPRSVSEWGEICVYIYGSYQISAHNCLFPQRIIRHKNVMNFEATLLLVGQPPYRPTAVWWIASFFANLVLLTLLILWFSL